MSSPTSTKHRIYRVATVIFGAVFGFFLHMLVLLAVPGGENYVGLPFAAASLLAAGIGAIGGIPLGRVWWRIVYFEKRGGLWRKL